MRRVLECLLTATFYRICVVIENRLGGHILSIIFIADDSLFPTNSGGRAEALAECLALVEQGLNVRLIVSHRTDISLADMERHRSIDPGTVFIKRQSLVKSTLRRPFAPYQLASRAAPSTQIKPLLEASGLRAVIASHEWTVELGNQIASQAQVPLILRSHNDEVEYMTSLAVNCKSVKRFYFHAEAVRLKWNLTRLMKHVDAVAVLSQADAESYAKFPAVTRLVPPVLINEVSDDTPIRRSPPSTSDILFVGSLDAPQAVEGLRWFIEHVFPSIQAQIPEAELVVAGRRASTALAGELRSHKGIRFLGEVQELEPITMAARVFINPVFGGSGVNMKVGPPSTMGLPVVTTSKGARGLDNLQDGLSIGDSASDFARSCTDLLRSDTIWNDKSAKLAAQILHYSKKAAGVGLQSLVNELNA